MNHNKQVERANKFKRFLPLLDRVIVLVPKKLKLSSADQRDDKLKKALLTQKTNIYTQVFMVCT